MEASAGKEILFNKLNYVEPDAELGILDPELGILDPECELRNENCGAQSPEPGARTELRKKWLKKICFSRNFFFFFSRNFNFFHFNEKKLRNFTRTRSKWALKRQIF